MELEFELELLLEFELELELELELEFELELELELLLWFELELLLELLLWLELELLLWFELEFELVLLLWLELWFDLDRADWARSRLIVRRFWTARARHHSIDFPSILTRTGAAAGVPRAGFAVRAALSSIGAAIAGSSSERDDSGSTADPTARPSAPNAPA